MNILERFDYLFIVAGIIIVTFLLATIFRKTFGRYIKYSTEVLENDPTNYQFLKHSISALIYLIGIGWALYTLPAFKAVASSILTGAGILAVVAGLASQHALSNIMSGIFLVIFKPFKVNDRIQIKDSISGVVKDITLRHTIIRDYENKRIIIPNSVISDEIIVNADFANEKICRRIDLPISFESNIELAKRIISEEAASHNLQIDTRTPEQVADGVPEITVRVLSIGEYSVNLRAWIWAKDASDSFVLACDLLERIKVRFDKEGIELPYPHRTIVNKSATTIS